MNKISKNQKGFTVVEGLLLILIFVVIGGLGYMVYKNHHKAIGPVTGKWSNYIDTKGNFSVLSPTPSYSPTFIPQTTQSHDGATYKLNGIAFLTSTAVDGEDDVLYLTFPSSAKVPSISSYLNGLLKPNEDEEDEHLISFKHTTVSGKQAETYELTAIRKPTKVPGEGGRSLPSFKIYDNGEVVRDGKVIYQIDATAATNTTSYQADAQYFVSSFKITQ